MIELLLLDWHGVLDLTKFSDVTLFISKIREAPPNLIKAYLEPHADQWAEGSITGDHFWDAVSREYGLGSSELEEAKSKIMKVQPNNEMWDALSELTARYKLAILSGCPKEKAELIRVSTDLSIFSGVYFSGEYGLTKKDNRFFELPLSEMNVPPRNALVVDDRYVNVERGKRIGMDGHTFRGAGEFMAYLATTSL